MADDETPAHHGRPLERASDGLGVNEAAEKIGVHPQTIRNWIRKGDLPVTRFGADGPGRRPRARIHPDDLADLVSQE